jgi:CHASE3 domain sensor protein
LIINLRRTQGFTAAVDAAGSVPDERDTEFQSLVGKMQDEEERLLVQRMAATDRDRAQTKMILLYGTLFGILVAGLAA